MVSGGARLRNGPAPDPNALRRDRKDDAGWITLAADACASGVPVWPLPGQSVREAELWELYWRKPQSVIWERNGQVLEVALHVRSFAEAELPDAPVSLRTLIRQQLESLLLTIPALNAARYRIGDAVSEAPRAVVALEGRKSARDRLKAVSGGAN